MEKINFKIIHVDYCSHRKAKDAENGITRSIDYETCRQNLNEMMKVMGIDPKIFKVGKISNQAFQFDENDKEKVFKLLDCFTDNEFVVIRKGKFFKVAPEKIRFYIDTFADLMVSAGMEKADVDAQIKQMKQMTLYEYVVALNDAKQTVASIEKDFDTIIENDGATLYYEDRVAHMRYSAELLHALQDRVRHVFLNISDYRLHCGLRGESDIIRGYSAEEKADFKERLVEQLKLEQALGEDRRYVELNAKRAVIIQAEGFLKKKQADIQPLEKEMQEISHRIQMELFGRIIENDLLYGEKCQRRIEKDDSIAVLKDAVDGYERYRIVRDSRTKPEDEPIGEEFCRQFFKNKNV